MVLLLTQKTLQVLFIITGVFALFFSLITYISKKKSRIIILKAISDLWWGFNFLCQGAPGVAPAIQNFSCIIREGICFGREKRIRIFENKFWIFVVIAIYSLIPIFSFDKVGWLFLLPYIGSIISLFSLYTRNSVLTKILTIPSQGLCLAYSIIIFNLFGILGYSFMILSAIIGLIYYAIDQKRFSNK